MWISKGQKIPVRCQIELRNRPFYFRPAIIHLPLIRLAMERVSRAVLIAVAMLATIWATGVDGNSHGAPLTSCSDMGAVHVAFPSKSPETCPFGITFAQTQISKGGKVNVTLSANAVHDSPQSRLPEIPGYFTGFLLMAFNAEDEMFGPIGTFWGFNPKQGQHLDCNDRPMSALTHVNANFKPTIHTEWVAPEGFVGTVVFKATFTSNIATIWAAVPSQDHVTIVDDTTAAPTPTTTPSTAAPITTPSTAAPITTPATVPTTPASAGRMNGSWMMVVSAIVLAVVPLLLTL